LQTNAIKKQFVYLLPLKPQSAFRTWN
jgi:hypothetical protein